MVHLVHLFSSTPSSIKALLFFIWITISASEPSWTILDMAVATLP